MAAVWTSAGCTNVSIPTNERTRDLQFVHLRVPSAFDYKLMSIASTLSEKHGPRPGISSFASVIISPGFLSLNKASPGRTTCD